MEGEIIERREKEKKRKGCTEAQAPRFWPMLPAVNAEGQKRKFGGGKEEREARKGRQSGDFLWRTKIGENVGR